LKSKKAWLSNEDWKTFEHDLWKNIDDAKPISEEEYQQGLQISLQMSKKNQRNASC